jgi:hypothetical protein
MAASPSTGTCFRTRRLKLNRRADDRCSATGSRPEYGWVDAHAAKSGDRALGDLPPALSWQNAAFSTARFRALFWFSVVVMQLLGTRRPYSIEARVCIGLVVLGFGDALCTPTTRGLPVRTGLAGMDVTDLQYLAVTADSGNFARAARLLGLNASTISRRVARLEGELGLPIFERGRKGLRVTSGGRQVIR